jgi:hypothetical protein
MWRQHSGTGESRLHRAYSYRRLGWLGFIGFLGFLGFLGCHWRWMHLFHAFFIFLSFFGFLGLYGLKPFTAETGSGAGQDGHVCQ